MDPFELVRQNNEWSAAQAQKQMDFQERMSNTAHQREIEDLKAAGLNPVLSAKLGGASTPNGAMAQADTSGTSAIIDSMLSGIAGASSAAGYAKKAEDSGVGPSKLFGWGLDLALGSKSQKIKALKDIAGTVEKQYKEKGGFGDIVVRTNSQDMNPLVNSGSTAGSESEKTPWWIKAYENMASNEEYRKAISYHNSPVEWMINHGYINPVPGAYSMPGWLKTLLFGRKAFR